MDEGFAGRMVRSGNNDGCSPVTGFANLGEDRHLAQERYFLPARLFLSATMTKNFDPLAIGRREITHVLHDAKDGNVYLVEHGDAFAHDAQRRFLRGGDDHTAIE